MFLLLLLIIILLLLLVAVGVHVFVALRLEVPSRRATQLDWKTVGTIHLLAQKQLALGGGRRSWFEQTTTLHPPPPWVRRPTPDPHRTTQDNRPLPVTSTGLLDGPSVDARLAWRQEMDRQADRSGVRWVHAVVCGAGE